ncbi:Homeobox protein not2 [Amphibalanus amphitrite]|uniref:Homeobox protein not2 n=1 Tax=Amphibalanus amphitrite TaxID=1232801 RepID=A0A6A4X4K9_AMPAM|nr:Homeobox protein not2 [Amphibalanus amphitrite]
MDDAAAKLHFASLLGMPPQLMYPFMFPPAACTLYRTPTSSPSSSPPGSPALAGCEGSPPSSKSFTIDAILGLRPSQERAMEPQHCARLTVDGATDVHKEKLGVSGRRVGRPKRVRTIFTTEQLDSMEKAFTMQQYMVGKQRCHLAKTLNLHENQVKVWFQNRRIKWRRQNLEREQARLGQLSRRSDSPPAGAGRELSQLECPASPASAGDRRSPALESSQLDQRREHTELPKLCDPPVVTET